MSKALGFAAAFLLLSACAVSPSAAPTMLAPSAATAPSQTDAEESRPPATCASSIPDYWRTSVSYAAGGKTLPPIAITLTCDGAVAAAWAALPSAKGVTAVEFGYGAYCVGTSCPAAPPNNGYVAFRFTDGRTVIVGVQSDDRGRVTAGRPITLQSAPPLPGEGQGG